MKNIRVCNVGDYNISNCGEIKGDCVVNDKRIIFNVMNNSESVKKMNEAIKAITESAQIQGKLCDILVKQKEIDMKNAEANLIRARADETNSQANLNISNCLLQDKSQIEKLIQILEKNYRDK